MTPKPLQAWNPWRLAAPAAAWLAVALLGSACAAPASGGAAGSTGTRPPAAAPAARAAGSSADLLARVQAEIGQPVCTAAAQCRSIAVGHKACGGPEAYLAWSTTVSNEARLKAAVAAHAAARQREDEQSGRMSNCMLLNDPGARCEAGRCVLNAGGGNAPAPMMVR